MSQNFNIYSIFSFIGNNLGIVLTILGILLAVVSIYLALHANKIAIIKDKIINEKLNLIIDKHKTLQTQQGFNQPVSKSLYNKIRKEIKILIDNLPKAGNIKNRARILASLGVANYKINNLRESLNNFLEALVQYRKLAKKESEIFKQDVTMTLNNLGILLRNMKKNKETEDSYREALVQYRELTKERAREI